MANRYLQQFFYSFTRNLTSLNGPIALASGTVGVSSSSIVGASAARTGVGEITITLVDKWPSLVFVDAQILSATARDLVPQVKSIDLTAKTIVINLLTGASPTDPLNAMTLYVNMMFKNSSVTY